MRGDCSFDAAALPTRLLSASRPSRRASSRQRRRALSSACPTRASAMAVWRGCGSSQALGGSSGRTYRPRRRLAASRLLLSRPCSVCSRLCIASRRSGALPASGAAPCHGFPPSCSQRRELSAGSPRSRLESASAPGTLTLVPARLQARTAARTLQGTAWLRRSSCAACPISSSSLRPARRSCCMARHSACCSASRVSSLMLLTRLGPCRRPANAAESRQSLFPPPRSTWVSAFPLPDRRCHERERESGRASREL